METCGNCGIELICDTNDLEGDEKIRLKHTFNGGVYCEACAFQSPKFGEYEQTGKRILEEANQ